MPATKLVSVRLPVALWKRVRRAALDDGISAAAAVEDALEVWLGSAATVKERVEQIHIAHEHVKDLTIDESFKQD